ncbi:MAG: hypothetical protein RLY90_548 [Pseudomonadota bacterium]
MRSKQLAGLVLALFGVVSTAAHAGPAEYVYTPTVEEGEKEIDFKSGFQKNRDGSSQTATSLGFGYGVNSWWFSELYAKYQRAPGEASAFDAWEWENKFQLTETGQYAVDVGFLLEIERPQDRGEGYELTYGPLFQKEWGNVQGNFNLLWQKHVRATETFDTELKYQGQLKYRASEHLEWGAQAFGTLGQWDKWAPRSEQEHKWGPALFGKFRVGSHEFVKWNAALLHGFTDGTANNTLRLQAEYEF